MNTKTFKKIAESKGYEFWYDRNIRLWTLTKDGYETNYYTKYVIDNLTDAQVDNIFPK